MKNNFSNTDNNNRNNKKSAKNLIDSIEYIENDDFLPFIINKIENKNSQSNDTDDKLLNQNSDEQINKNKNILNQNNKTDNNAIIKENFTEPTEKENEINNDVQEIKLEKIEKTSDKNTSNTSNNKDNTDDIKIDKKNYIAEIRKIKKQKNDNSELEPVNDIDEIEDLKEVEEVEELEEVDELEELNELNEVEENDIDTLIEKIDPSQNKIEYPGKINIENIDKSLKYSDTSKLDLQKEEDQAESFGINRVEVFYNIDKKIYSSKSQIKYSKKELREAKKGLLLPTLFALSILFICIVGITTLSFYFKSQENAELADTLTKEKNSLLFKILEEQRQQELLKLEEDKKKLADDKKRYESEMNEELKKKEAEIENNFKKQLEELEQKGVTSEEYEKLKSELESTKQKALEDAQTEIDERLNLQNQLLADKEKEYEDAIKKIEDLEANQEKYIAEEKKEYERLKSELSKNREQIKNFNAMIYSLITGSMQDFQKGNYDSAISKLNAVLDHYKTNEEFVQSHEELKTKMLTDMFLIETISTLINESKSDLNFNEKYADIINKFEKLTDYYKNAENLFNQQRYTKSSKEYEKVLSEFEEINIAYKRIKQLEKNDQNAYARANFNDAMENIKKNNYEIALDQLTNVINEAPMSDYTNQALNEIIKINETISEKHETDKIKKQNEEAEKLIDKAEKLKKNQSYEDALVHYHKIITDYPYSDYNNLALKESIEISKIIQNEINSDLDENLKKRFEDDYKNFQKYYKKGDFENARKYYFDALKNAFDMYANNSIYDFKALEDDYIESLLAEAEKNYQENENNNELLKQLENEKKELEQKYKDLLDKTKNSNISTSKKDEIMKQYEEELVQKNEEIDKLRNYIIEKEKNWSEKDIEQKLNDYKDELLAEKEKTEKLKKQLYDYYQKQNELKEEREKISQLENELKNIKNQFKELEKKYNEKDVTIAEREQLKKELTEVLKKQYEIELKRELALEREKIRKEYEIELEKIKKQFTQSKYDFEYLSETIKIEGFIFGRVTDIVNDSIAFQFISLESDTNQKVKIGDKVQIIRFAKINNKTEELLIGYLEINSVKDDSLYGRGRIISYVKGYNVYVGDLLKR